MNENFKITTIINLLYQFLNNEILPKLIKLNYGRSPHRSQADRDGAGCLIVANTIAIILFILIKGCS